MDNIIKVISSITASEYRRNLKSGIKSKRRQE
jgi:hypothetical protein